MSEQSAFDWSQFQLGIFINDVHPDVIYSLWATSGGLTRWFLREADFAPSDTVPPKSKREQRKVIPFDELAARPPSERCQKNDRYRWEWYYDGGIVGEQWIIDARPPSKLIFGFGLEMTVEVSIRRVGSDCEVVLRQFNIPSNPRGRTDLHLGCRVAWAFFLANLKSLAEGGIDLRETDTSRARRLHLVNI